MKNHVGTAAGAGCLRGVFATLQQSWYGSRHSLPGAKSQGCRRYFVFSSDFFAALTFAHRAFCARRIAARPLALKGRRVLFFAGPLPL